MTEVSWQAETAGAAIVGTVQYRCSACGELVDAEAAVFSAEPTAAYHPEHAPPQQED